MIDERDMQAVLASTSDERIRRPAAAWLVAYSRARWLAFNETVSRHHGDVAWDQSVQDLAAATTIATVEVN